MEIATFVIAVIAIVVAALSFGWQIAAWLLDGRRVTAELRYGANSYLGILSGPVKKDGTPLDVTYASVPGGLLEEVIGIEVTNSSRTARVRVETIQAHVKDGPAFDPRGGAFGDPLPTWLEAGETKSWYMDAETARKLVEISRRSGKKVNKVAMVARLSHGKSVTTRQQLHVSE